MYRLTPIVHSSIEALLTDKDLLCSLVNQFGSPLNIIFPTIVLENYEAFSAVLAKHSVPGKIFYAHKANQSIAILRALANHPHTAVDVASAGELIQALAAGFTGQRIEATGPKNRAFLRLALLHGVTINLNSATELTIVEQLRKELTISNPIRVYIRMQSFATGSAHVLQKDSKFGFPESDIKHTLAELAHQTKQYDLIGFSFHLTTTSHKERLLAIEAGFQHIHTAIKLGLTPRALNIGGGFSINYLAHGSEWETYVTALKESLLDHTHESMSWNNSGLGFWAEANGIRGTASFSDYYRNQSQYQELDTLLGATTNSYGPVGQFLKENGLALHLEPGRSVLDQAGITIGRVLGSNQSSNGERIIFMDMNRSHLNAIELEYMVDPIHLAVSDQASPSGGVYLSGNLCLPHDFLTRRKVFFNQIPQPNDLLIFGNTAGYHMDFTESHTALQAVAPKIVYQDTQWYTDDAYQP